jgi:hypothetical protein
MPILFGDRLIGKIDATTDRRHGVLQVNAVHQDVRFTRAMTADIDQELVDLAAWLEVDLAGPE